MTALGRSALLLTLTFVLSLSTASAAQVERTLRVDGRERTYIVCAPKDATEAMPVVFMLHGGGGTAARIVKATGFNELAERENFIVVYPQAFDNHWNDGRGVPFMRAQSENVDDIRFLRAVLADVAKQHRVDASRVFLTGISNGGIMAHRVAAEAADMVAAIAPVVGGMPPQIGKEFQPAQPVSIYIIQGDADRVVPIDGGGVSLGGVGRGQVLPTSETVQKYVALNGNKGEVMVTKLGEANDPIQVITSKYPDGTGGAKTWYSRVHHGGHAWYRAANTAGLSATQAVWEFFKACPARGGDPR